MRWTGTFLGLVAATLAAACSGDGSGGTASGVPGAVTAVSGDAQTDTVVGTLPAALVVKVTDQSGNALSGATVTWAATAGFGTFDTTTTHTDATGQAHSHWTLGVTPGAQTATATVSGLTAVTFHATARVASPASIFYSGQGQVAAAGTRLAAPLLVQVKDKFGNPVPGALVTWTVLSGGGLLSAASVPTDTTGQSQVTWTLGSPGPQSARATAPDSLSVTFSATAS